MRSMRLLPVALTAAVFVSACGTAREIEATALESCVRCHDLPPASGKHTIAPHAHQTCWRCHSEVATNTEVPGIADDPTAQALHQNGVVDVSFSVGGTWEASAKTCSSVACHSPPTATRSW